MADGRLRFSRRHDESTTIRRGPGVTCSDTGVATLVAPLAVKVRSWPPDTRDTHGHEHLDHQLVARRRCHVWRRAEPSVELCGAGIGDPERLLRASVGGVVGFRQSVTLEPLQGRVHLADVEWPDLPRTSLELLAELGR